MCFQKKKRYLLSIFAFLTLFFSAEAQSYEALIKIYADPIKKDYKVLYSAQNELPVVVKLVSPDGGEVFNEDFGTTKAFVKVYSLRDAPLGMYKWEIKYGNKTYSEEFEIQSEKKLIKESIKVDLDDLLNLKISVEKYNKLPLSIFFYDGAGKQLDFIFWEPTLQERDKVISLSSYDAYDIRLEILQQGDVAYEKKYQTY